MERGGSGAPAERGKGQGVYVSREAARGRETRRQIEKTREYVLSHEQRQATETAVAGMEQRYGRALTQSELRAIERAEPEFYGVLKRHDAQGYQANAAGKVFEKGVTDLLIAGFGYDEKKDGVFTHRERNMSTRESNIAEDILEGADVMVNQLPVDITINPEKGGAIGSVNDDGQMTEGFVELGELDGVKVSSGFRMTNGAHKLQMPVCVILFEGARERLDTGDMLEKLRAHPQQFRELADDAMAAYWNYADAMEGAA